jgi:CHAT domain-containing protein
MAVVAGDYSNSGWDELPEATKEAKALAGEYEAKSIDADLRTVLELLKGNPKVDLVHFAVHGQYDGEVGRDGLIMVDGQVLNGNKVLARPLDGPFVFLNACQVGAGNKILAGAAGLAADFVNAGASGVVAPLWSVKDTIAREIAQEFYSRVFGEPRVSPAVALRECRAKFRDDPAASPTYLAYQFFGGPNMTLIRE